MKGDGPGQNRSTRPPPIPLRKPLAWACLQKNGERLDALLIVRNIDYPIQSLVRKPGRFGERILRQQRVMSSVAGEGKQECIATRLVSIER